MASRSIVFLDTHILVWLYDALIDKLSVKAQTLIESSELKISPMVLLELKYLFEIERVAEEPSVIYQDLGQSLRLSVDDTDFLTVIHQASMLTWTRDPFDRIIVAQATVYKAPLITADRTIQKHYSLSIC